MKKRKGGDVDEHRISERKRKALSLVDEKQNNPSEVVRTVKGLLHKEQTRLAGMLKIGKKYHLNLLFFQSITVFVFVHWTEAELTKNIRNHSTVLENVIKLTAVHVVYL